ncbi:hypothetical protein GWK47_050204 [Chionoecetes opilio]|uniref:Uncharacterized protein n=1 Tax=Chionoecetes opilio TaxID=41210 RepID=A0A8J4Y318_CHIOP|nr:hypothetical protein GWK47_050204 [Chionoecetes opilio]
MPTLASVSGHPSVALSFGGFLRSRAFHLDRSELGSEDGCPLHSRFVYISAPSPNIVPAYKGEFLIPSSRIQDSPDSPVSSLLPPYPLTLSAVYPALAKDCRASTSARRFYQKGSAINRLVVTWSLLSHLPRVSPLASFQPAIL